MVTMGKNMTDIIISKEKNEYLKILDSEYGYGIAKDLLEFRTTQDGFRNAGTPAEHEAADWLTAEMKKIGLSEVTKESFSVDAWEFHGATVSVMDHGFKTMHAGSFSGLEGTEADGVTGQIVYVGEGTAKDYQSIDAKDKIVLIDTDAYYTYWYNLVFEEAQAQGAKAIIATVTDRGPGTYRDDLITIQNIQGFVDIPAVMMNKRDSRILRNAVKKYEGLTANITIDVKTTKNAKAHYVYGMIKGKHPASRIIYSAHYDAYWDGFLDNASACGTVLAIAKGMIDSGYQPDSTIIFVANGAEEYGRLGSAYDYCIGSTVIVKKHPEWVENTKACFNFELTAHNQLDRFVITVTAGYAKWFHQLIDQTKLVGKYKVIPTSISGADNIVFTKAGIPTCMNVSTYFGGDEPESASNYDHTQYDNLERYDAKAFDAVNRVYGILGMLIDRTPVIPMDFHAYTDHFWDNIDLAKLSSWYHDTEELERVVNEFNELRLPVEKADAGTSDENWDMNKVILEVNRMFMNELYQYNASSELAIGHLQPYSYAIALDSLISCLIEGNGNTASKEAVDQVLALDHNYLITAFGKEVYEKTVIHAFEKEVPKEWAEGNTIPFPNLYDVITSVMQKHASGQHLFEEEIRILKEIRDVQVKLLCDILDKEKQLIISAKEKLGGWI